MSYICTEAAASGVVELKNRNKGRAPARFMEIIRPLATRCPPRLERSTKTLVPAAMKKETKAKPPRKKSEKREKQSDHPEKPKRPLTP